MGIINLHDLQYYTVRATVLYLSTYIVYNMLDG